MQAQRTADNNTQTVRPKGDRRDINPATSSQAPPDTARRPVAAVSPATLTDAQARAEEIGLDPRLVSDRVDELLSLEHVDWKNDKAYTVRRRRDGREVYMEIVGATRSKSGIIYSKGGKAIGFIDMPKTSPADRMRQAISAAGRLVRKTNGGKVLRHT